MKRFHIILEAPHVYKYNKFDISSKVQILYWYDQMSKVFFIFLKKVQDRIILYKLLFYILCDIFQYYKVTGISTAQNLLGTAVA